LNVLPNPCPRPQALERLQRDTFDVLVIGGGIIGARVALEARLHGKTVALVEATDFGGATSSASSKLIHGGLRYLEQGEVGLVHEAHTERRALMTHIAPHLVRSLDFLVPVYEGATHGPLMIRTGMLAYSALSGFRQSRSGMVDAHEARRMVPELKLEGLRATGVYRDAQTNDARLVLSTVVGAARAGAVVLNRARVEGLERSGSQLASAFVRTPEAAFGVRFRSVVNAAGPWVDGIRRLEDPGVRPIGRLSKGVHVTVPLPSPWKAALTVPMDRGRVAFAVPWEGMLLLGTTDTPYEGEPGAVEPVEADVDTILAEASVALTGEVATWDNVLSAFAGLRVLPLTTGDTADAPREHVIRVGSAGMISVAGGKLTTHRRIALDVVRRLPGLDHVHQHEEPLPGAGTVSSHDPRVDDETWQHLTHWHGSEAGHVLSWELMLGPEALERVHPSAPEIWAELHHAVANEWAMSVEDLLRRRTNLELRGLAGEVRERVARVLQPAST
jgi:glycerol-3-phosphate dehydrogenase